MAERRALRLKNVADQARSDVGATRRPDRDFTRTVTVACKLPTGLILKTYHKEMGREAIPGGFRATEISVADDKSFRLNGTALPVGGSPSYLLVGGYALTPNIPAEFWEKWVEQHKDMDIVKNGIVKAFAGVDGGRASADSYARDHKGVKSGLEPINPDKPPVPRISTLKKDDDK